MVDTPWSRDRLTQSYVEAYGRREDARPRPRLTWRKANPECWVLELGAVMVGKVYPREFCDHTGADPWEVKPATSMRDAAILLRLRLLATGFDVDDVPTVILGGGA